LIIIPNKRRFRSSQSCRRAAAAESARRHEREAQAAGPLPWDGWGGTATSGRAPAAAAAATACSPPQQRTHSIVATKRSLFMQAPTMGSAIRGAGQSSISVNNEMLILSKELLSSTKPQNSTLHCYNPRFELFYA